MTVRGDIRERTLVQAGEEFNHNRMCLMLVDVGFVDAFSEWSGPVQFRLSRGHNGMVTMDMRDPMVKVSSASENEDT